MRCVILYKSLCLSLWFSYPSLILISQAIQFSALLIFLHVHWIGVLFALIVSENLGQTENSFFYCSLQLFTMLLHKNNNKILKNIENKTKIILRSYWYNIDNIIWSYIMDTKSAKTAHLPVNLWNVLLATCLFNL